VEHETYVQQQRYTIVKRHFDRDLEELKSRLLRMGGTVEDLIVRAIESLRQRDRTLLEEAAGIESSIDREEVAIEEECLKLIALYQPVAGDLRFIASVLKINSELERMGDLALHIAERARALAGHTDTVLPNELREMAKRVQTMVHGSLEALVDQDSERALQVMHADDEVDAIHRQMFDLIAARIAERPADASTWLEMLSASRYLERIADSATNIAEDVYYLVEGRIIRHSDDTP